MTETINDGDSIDLCFLDFSKVFKKISHLIICATLSSLTLQDFEVGWHANFKPVRRFIDAAIADVAAVLLESSRDCILTYF